MQITNQDTLRFFMEIFVPGFLFIKTYGLFQASNTADFSKKWYDAAGIGCIFASLFWMAVEVFQPYIIWQKGLLYVFCLAVFPCSIAWLFATQPGNCDKLRFLYDKLHMLRQEATAWDYIFSKPVSYWVVVTLRDGNKVSGLYSGDSFSTSYPFGKDLYLEQEYKNVDGSIDTIVPKTAGVWIHEDQIAYLQFQECRYEEDNNCNGKSSTECRETNNSAGVGDKKWEAAGKATWEAGASTKSEWERKQELIWRYLYGKQK